MRRLLVVLLLAPALAWGQISFPPSGGTATTVITTPRGAASAAPACAAGTAGTLYVVTDAADTTDCTVGQGASVNLCVCSGASWTDSGPGVAGAGTAFPTSPAEGDLWLLTSGTTPTTCTAGAEGDSGYLVLCQYVTGTWTFVPQTSGPAFPLVAAADQRFVLTSALTAGSCDTEGQGTAAASCRYDAVAEAWVADPLQVEGVSTLAEVLANGKTTTGLTSFANAIVLGGATGHVRIFEDGAGLINVLACPNAATDDTTCVTWHLRARDDAIGLYNDDNARCLEWNKDTMALVALAPGGDCTGAFTVTGNQTVSGTITAGQALITKSTAVGYTVGTTDAREPYNGVVYVTGAATITLPAIAVGMKVTVITVGDFAVSVDPNAADKLILDGTALADGNKATNPAASQSGSTLVCLYYSADGWYCASGSNAGTLWSDGGA